MNSLNSDPIYELALAVQKMELALLPPSIQGGTGPYNIPNFQQGLQQFEQDEVTLEQAADQGDLAAMNFLHGPVYQALSNDLDTDKGSEGETFASQVNNMQELSVLLHDSARFDKFMQDAQPLYNPYIPH